MIKLVNIQLITLFDVIAARAGITSDWYDLAAIPENAKAKILAPDTLKVSWDNINGHKLTFWNTFKIY